jgi:hypothetical protein
VSPRKKVSPTKKASPRMQSNPPDAAADPPFTPIVDAFADDRHVTLRKMFSSSALTVVRAGGLSRVERVVELR